MCKSVCMKVVCIRMNIDAKECNFSLCGMKNCYKYIPGELNLSLAIKLLSDLLLLLCYL